MTISVADLCQQHTIELDELCRRSDLTSDRVRAIIEGRWTPSPAERQAIADVFELAPTEIAWGHKTPIQHLYGHGPG